MLGSFAVAINKRINGLVADHLIGLDNVIIHNINKTVLTVDVHNLFFALQNHYYKVYKISTTKCLIVPLFFPNFMIVKIMLQSDSL